MGRKTSSIAHKKRQLRVAQDARMTAAIAEYRKLESTENATKPSARDVALRNKVPPTTFRRILAGGIPLSEFNAAKRHLKPSEERVILEFAKSQAKKGFPLSHKLLESRANAILKLRKGPEFKVGVSWVSRFLETHQEEISVYWSRSLGRSRANGLNPVAVRWYFDVLEELERSGVPAENWYAADETGIALGQAMRTLVIGPAGEKIQHKQQDVEREIVTVLETICADGTYLRPTVIFKGKNILKKWGSENP